jgi:hypothetical protein
MDECDFVIPLHRFHKMVRTTIESIGSFYNPRTIYIITPEKYVVEIEQVIENWNFKRVIVIDEETFFIKNYNLTKLNIEFELFNNNIDHRSREFGWWYQQIIKLGAFKQITGLSDPYVVWDSDLIPLVKWDLYNNGMYTFALLQHSARSEWNVEQYKDSLHDLTGLKMIVPEEGGTFVPHHFIFHHRVLEYTLNAIEKRNEESTWIHSIIGLSHRYFRFSEYILIATFMKMYFPDLLSYYSFEKYGYSGKRIREPKMLLEKISEKCNINGGGLSYENFCKFMYFNYDSIPSYMQIEHI